MMFKKLTKIPKMLRLHANLWRGNVKKSKQINYLRVKVFLEKKNSNVKAIHYLVVTESKKNSWFSIYLVSDKSAYGLKSKWNVMGNTYFPNPVFYSSKSDNGVNIFVWINYIEKIF